MLNVYLVVCVEKCNNPTVLCVEKCKDMKRKIAGRRIAINPLYAISNLYK